jgi:hypothetical protein
MRDCARNVVQLNKATRKLDQSGYIQRQCGIVNTELKVKKLKNSLQLSQSMVTTEKDHDNEAAQKRVDIQSTYRSLAPAEVCKLESEGSIGSKIIKKEIVLLNYAHSRNPTCVHAHTHRHIQVLREPLSSRV